jgi:RNAse (barnase) inhibitor barstar
MTMDDLDRKFADPKLSGVYQLTREPYEAERAAKAADLAVFRIDIGHAHHKEELLEKLAKAMGFPAHFGNNWDALHDCLTDLDWLKAKGYVIVFEKSKHFGAGHKHDFEAATEVLRAVAEYWHGKGKPFCALIHGAVGWDSGLPKWPAT